jgi:hypothetical protein
VRLGRTYNTIAGYLSSFIALSRFVHAVRVSRATAGTTVSTIPVEGMRRIHKQVTQKARVEYKFTSKPVAWLDWEQVQTARGRAVRQYEHYEGQGTAMEQRTRLFDATLITWLTSVPPDRVGVTRQLCLGDTLKPTRAGYNLDLSKPNAHKTAAVFGPSVTAVPAPTCKLLAAWVQLAGLSASPTAPPYVFVLNDQVGHGQPVDSKHWTKIVQAAFKRHAGVALAPKELRSSYITWLRSDEHSDAVLRRAAQQMRHSTSQQSSATYDREGAARLSAAAVRAAGAHAARF